MFICKSNCKELNRNKVFEIIPLQVFMQAINILVHKFKMQFTYIEIFLLQVFLRTLKEFYFCFMISEE
jgi:hypothetical protein